MTPAKILCSRFSHSICFHTRVFGVLHFMLLFVFFRHFYSLDVYLPRHPLFLCVMHYCLRCALVVLSNILACHWFCHVICFASYVSHVICPSACIICFYLHLFWSHTFLAFVLSSQIYCMPAFSCIILLCIVCLHVCFTCYRLSHVVSFDMSLVLTCGWF